MKMGAFFIYCIGGIFQLALSCNPTEENIATLPTSPPPTTMKQTTKSGCMGIQSDIFTEDGLPCIFPFFDGQKEHKACVDWNGKYQWCATSLKSRCRYQKWGKCVPQEATTSTLSSIEQGPTDESPSNIMIGCDGSFSQTTFTKTGLPCIFPFYDGDKEHSSCADWKGKYLWCATSLKTTCRYLKWEECKQQGSGEVATEGGGESQSGNGIEGAGATGEVEELAITGIGGEDGGTGSEGTGEGGVSTGIGGEAAGGIGSEENGQEAGEGGTYELVDDCNEEETNNTINACLNRRLNRQAKCSSEPSESCAAEGGYCGDPASCPDNNVIHNKCPGGNDNKCCLSIPYQEAECDGQEGQCTDRCGCEGEVLHGFCQSQPDSIKCCKAADITEEAMEQCVTQAPTPLNCPDGTTSNCNNGQCTVTCSGADGGEEVGAGDGTVGNGEGGVGGGLNCANGYNSNCNNGKCTVTCSGSGGGNNNNNNNGKRKRRRKRQTGEMCPIVEEIEETPVPPVVWPAQPTNSFHCTDLEGNTYVNGDIIEHGAYRYTCTGITTMHWERTQIPIEQCTDIQGEYRPPPFLSSVGSCQTIASCTGNSLIVGHKCPGTTYCCVPNPFPCTGETNVNSEKHLATTEGNIWLEGYLPSNGSGVTIATGYDLGHGPDISECLNDTGLWNRLLPYRELESVLELENAGFEIAYIKYSNGIIVRRDLNPLQPIVKLKEARMIDCCLKARSFEAQAAYTVNMDCGKTVVASLTHWCGVWGARGVAADYTRYDITQEKCRKGSNYLGAVLQSYGDDADLLAKLESLRDDHANGHEKTRFEDEIDYMENCM